MMTWRESLIARHEKDVATFKQGIELMRRDDIATGEIDAQGRQVDTTAESIATYERIVSELEHLLGKLRNDATLGR